MRWVCRPIRIGVVRSDDFYPAARLRDAMQLVDEAKHIRNMFDHMATNDLFKLVIGERVWKRSEIVNDVSVSSTVRVDTDRAGILVLTTADIKNSFLR